MIEKYPEGYYVIDRLVLPQDGANVVLASYTGEGKTTLSLEVALAMAIPTRLWGRLDTPYRLRVLYIDQENVGGQIRETVQRLSKVYGEPNPDYFMPLSGSMGKSFSILNQH